MLGRMEMDEIPSLPSRFSRLMVGIRSSRYQQVKDGDANNLSQ